MKKMRLASQEDDAALRKLVSEVPMEGEVGLTFQRDPSFFQAESIGNRWLEVMLLEENGIALGSGTRAGRRFLFEGKEVELGYVGMLRLAQAVRNSISLVRGYRFLSWLHEHSKHQVPYYLTTILSENHTARKLLESGRAGIPSYLPVTEYATYVVGRVPKRWRFPSAEVQVSSDVSDLETVLALSREWSKSFSLAPVYSMEDLSWLDTVRWEVLRVSHGDASASAILCDMTDLRQTIINGYPLSMRILPHINGIMGRLGYPHVPHVGEKLKTVYPCALSLRGDEEKASALLVSAIRGMSKFREAFVAIGFDKRLGWSKALSKGSISITDSMVYRVSWEHGLPSLPDLGAEPLHLDVGTL